MQRSKQRTKEDRNDDYDFAGLGFSSFLFFHLFLLLFAVCPVSRAIIRVTVFTQEATKLPFASSWNVTMLFQLAHE